MSSCLLEASSIRKNKITLTDYNYQKDIQNRLFLAKLTLDDLKVLEEILYSSLHVSLSDLASDLEMELDVLFPILEKLSSTGLFTLEKSSLSVDKEMRKYFELQLQKLEEDFEPNMEFLQSLLKKIPIHILPVWYSIPRTSNNIFQSLIEKNLLTPQIFQRYIMEINFGEPVLKQIIEDVYQSDDLEIPVEKLMKKYGISRELFEEYMLHLEFSFVCCVGYRRNENNIEAVVTPFHEWKQYIGFLKKTESPSITEEEKIVRFRPNEFSFVEDVAVFLYQVKKQKISLKKESDGCILPKGLSALLADFNSLSTNPAVYRPYLNTLIEKTSLVRLIDLSSDLVKLTSTAEEWLKLDKETQAMYFYRHPLNKISSKNVPQEICTEKALREGEKTILRILDKNWVFFEDFLKGCHAPLKEENIITLKCIGKNWKYTLPIYTSEEKEFLYSIIFEWLFQAGLVQTGSFEGKPCFRVSSLGKILFAR